MKLNTYRCGCGRIEPLPHPKARPGPCVHGTLGLRPIALRQPEWGRTRELAVQAVVVYDDGVDRTIALRGWELETQPFRKADGSAHVAVRARKGSRVIERLCPAQQEDYGISEIARQIDARYHFDRGGKFFAALRVLVKQLNFARAGGMRPWAKSLPDTVGPIPYSIAAGPGTTVKTSAPLAPSRVCSSCRGRRADRYTTTSAGPVYYCRDCDVDLSRRAAPAP